MGVVEAAVDRWLDRDVALKRPHTEAHLARVAREAKLTARLVHSAIPPIYDVGSDEIGPFYTMPVLTGASLDARLAEGGTSLRALVAAVATAARAAGYAHMRGVVHRDLKPANLLLGEHGEVWVLDWGVALDPSVPDDQVVGTPGYRAPEVEAGRRATPAADVYGLGRTLHAVLVSRPPPPAALQAVVERATRPDPRDRYADATALAQDLERWLDGQPVTAHAYPLGEVLLRALRRRRAPLTVAAVALVVLAATGVGALRAQQAERDRADGHLATVLAQRAASLLHADLRPEAEVLAAHALALREDPLARGVLMAWSASPPPRLGHVERPPCPIPGVEPDGHLVCLDDTLTVVAPDGSTRWTAPYTPPEGGWTGAVAEVRHPGDGVVVLRTTSNHVELWRAGARVATLGPFPTVLHLAQGTLPALTDVRRVGTLDPRTGDVAWGPETCAQVERALLTPEALVVACRDPVVYVGTLDDPGAPLPLPGHPSALAWEEGPLVGTFEGDLLVRHGSAWQAWSAGVGAIRQVLPLGGGRVAVVGEHGRARVVALAAGATLATLPSGVSRLARVGGELRTVGASIRRYDLPGTLRPVVHDRRAEGGIASFDVSPSGATLLAGSASGDVVAWSAATGEADTQASVGDATAKPVRFVDETTFVRAVPTSGTVVQPLGGAPTPLVPAIARVARAASGTLVLLPWSSTVVVVAPDGTRVLPLPARPLAARLGARLWITDERGGVHEAAPDGADLALRFTLPHPTAVLGEAGDTLVVADGADVVGRAHDGRERWRWAGTDPVTALDATPSWVAVGDARGRVHLLQADGTLVAHLPGHDRRVAEVVLRGDVLYSASWEGRVRAWGLDAATEAPAAAVARVTGTWALTLDEALAGSERPAG